MNIIHFISASLIGAIGQYSTFEKSLDDWVKEKAGSPEGDSRVRAAEKIRRCYATNATELDLRSSRLTSLPDCMGNLQNLYFLTLSDNALDSLSDWLGDLKNLQYLNASNNRLKSVTAKIGNLQNLRTLTLCDNALEWLPREIDQLRNLY